MQCVYFSVDKKNSVQFCAAIRDQEAEVKQREDHCCFWPWPGCFHSPPDAEPHLQQQLLLHLAALGLGPRRVILQGLVQSAFPSAVTKQRPTMGVA